MLVLLLINLTLIVMDVLYDWAPSAALWRGLWLSSHETFGRTVDVHFLAIESAFIAVFLAEFIVSWMLSVRRKEWPLWYAYAFLHWYDILGCIPLAPFRFLRLLRVANTLWRLHRLGWINITQWRLFRLGHKVYDIVVEEISDRVVVKVLSGVQDEIRSNGLLQKGLVERIVLPRKEALAKAVGVRVQVLVSNAYEHYRPEIDAIIRELVAAAVARNKELGRIEKIPMLGDYISRSIEHAIYDITGNVIAEAVERLDQGGAVKLATELLDGAMEALSPPGGDDGMQELTAAALDTLEFIKQRVAVREWLQPAATKPSLA